MDKVKESIAKHEEQLRKLLDQHRTLQGQLGQLAVLIEQRRGALLGVQDLLKSMEEPDETPKSE